jgi:hypothetical protein
MSTRGKLLNTQGFFPQIRRQDQFTALQIEKTHGENSRAANFAAAVRQGAHHILLQLGNFTFLGYQTAFDLYRFAQKHFAQEFHRDVQKDWALLV